MKKLGHLNQNCGIIKNLLSRINQGYWLLLILNSGYLLAGTAMITKHVAPHNNKDKTSEIRRPILCMQIQASV